MEARGAHNKRGRSSVLQPEQMQLEGMIIGAMQAIAPDVLKRCREKYCSESGGSEHPSRGQLLQELLSASGAGVFKELPGHFPQDSRFFPLLGLLLNSSSPVELLEKFVKFDKFLYPSRDLRLLDVGSGHVTVENRSADEDGANAAEDLFLHAMISYLLTRYGCSGLEVDWLSVRSKLLRKELSKLEVYRPPVSDVTRLRVRWSRYGYNRNFDGLDDFLANYIEPFVLPNTLSVVEKVERFFALDPSVKPGMEVVSDMLGISVRKLQRILRQEGTTYSRIYNELRIKTASRLLRRTDDTLTEIAFLCGFRDSSHFSREFKKMQQMTPKEYREIFKRCMGQNGGLL